MSVTKKKFRFYLLGYKGFKVLSDILENFGPEIVESVVIANDNKIDNDYFLELKELCENNGIKYFLRKERIPNTDYYSFAISWKWIINKNEINNLIILHDSILPKYRGFNPLVSALINGDKKIGVTAIYASEKYDEGDIIFQEIVDVMQPLTILEAIEIISVSYSILILKMMNCLLKDEVLPRNPQNNHIATYSLWRDEEDYRIDWNNDSERILRFIYATGQPYLGASSYLDDQKVRILDAEIYPDVNIENRVTGKVIFFEDSFPVIVCGKGLLKVKKIISDIDKKDLTLKKFRVRFK